MELMTGLEPVTSALPRTSSANRVCEPYVLKPEINKGVLKHKKIFAVFCFLRLTAIDSKCGVFE